MREFPKYIGNVAMVKSHDGAWSSGCATWSKEGGPCSNSFEDCFNFGMLF